jgi:hypothetical protein
MTTLTRLTTSAIKKIPLNPPLSKGEIAQQEEFPSLKKRGQGRFWTRVIG